MFERRMDTMMLTLTLAAGLLAAPQLQAEPPKGWIILDGGHDGVLTDHEYPKQAEPPKRKEWIIEPAFFKQFKVQVEPVEAFYVDDLRAYIEQVKKR